MPKRLPATRSRNQVRRALLLVDLLAPRRYWFKTNEIREMLRDRLGENLHYRTVYRDLRLLESLGMVDYKYSPNGRHGSCAVWRINLGRSESLQCAAIKACGE